MNESSEIAVERNLLAAEAMYADDMVDAEEDAYLASFPAIKVTVVIPVFEVEPYIKTCLNSIVSQTLQPLDVILVLKPGGDRSCEIAERYAAKNGWRVKYVEPDEKQGDSRNYGIDMAVGEYIAFVDSDDYVPPNAYELMLAKIEKTGADLVVGRTLRFNSKNRKGWRTPKLELGGFFDKSKTMRWEQYPWLVYNGAPWNKLISVKYLRDNNIRFPEKVFYEDVGFCLELFLNDPLMAVEPAYIYKWRVRDGAGEKSVTQQKGDWSNLAERMQVYDWIDGRVQHHKPPEKLVRAWEHRKFTDLMYYLQAYMVGTDYYRDMFRKTAPAYVAKISPAVLRQFPKGDRMIANWIRNGRFGLVDTLGEGILFYRETKTYLVKNTPKPVKKFLRYAGMTLAAPFAAAYYLGRTPAQWARRKRAMHWFSPRIGLFYNLCTKMLPVKKNVFLYEGVSGRQYAGNEKYIYQELKKRVPKARHVWAFQQQDGIDRNAAELAGAELILKSSWRYVYLLARAGHLFTGTSFPPYFRKRKAAKYVETWHGTPLKKLGFDIDASIGRELNRNSTENVMYPQSKMWDYFIAPNEFTAEKFSSAYKYNGDIMRTGYPRNDIFYYPSDEKERIVDKVRSHLNIPDGKKIILYAPTFKDGKKYGNRKTKIAFNLDIHALKERLEGDWILVVRAHLLSGGKFDPAPYGDFVRTALVDEYDDPQELCLAADVLITDYSSICFDFANTRKPIVFYCPDMEEYATQKRGFYFDPQTKFPGPFTVTAEEVSSSIDDLENYETEYREKYDAFIEEFCAWEDGNASARVADILGIKSK